MSRYSIWHSLGGIAISSYLLEINQRSFYSESDEPKFGETMLEVYINWQIFGCELCNFSMFQSFLFRKLGKFHQLQPKRTSLSTKSC